VAESIGLGAGSPIGAAVELGRRHGIATEKPAVLKDGSNLIVSLDPHPVIFRVATVTAWVRRDPRPYLEREVALATLLAGSGAAAVAPSELIAAGPHQLDGWWMTALGAVSNDGTVPSGAATLTALDRLHAALAGIDLELPELGPATTDLDLAWRALEQIRLLDGPSIRERAGRRDRLVGELQAAAPDRQPLHGDAFPRNSLMSPDGIVWIDFEDACRGPVAWDHAVLIRQGGDPGLEPILRARDGDAAIDAAIELRGLQAEAWTLLHDARSDGRLPIPASYLTPGST
jgi:hypothetical protein